ncbi:hypothetical protein M422DRAFT_251532 [Sphaerobolus stellatus SS14]|uniref:Unplaced genomic scaffold SPHSTscaffold_39, whole genome shotgun sequence n=1 Tax=Sphaerobolus stellatus (strain SS14) TaxID=990650 RepID=A0A0C9UPX0_SPHS4|nr:hypothetical protein M422DRAFT_251532 [Sphaerobolus stellatus SS14]
MSHYDCLYDASSTSRPKKNPRVGREERTSRPRPKIGGGKIAWEYLAEMTESQCEWLSGLPDTSFNVYVLAPALLTASSLALASKGPWDAFSINHAAKTLWTTVVETINETASSVSNFVGQSKSATIHGNSWVALEFGKGVLRWLRNALSEPSSPNISLFLAFTGVISDDSAMTAQKPILQRCSAASYSSSYRATDNTYRDASRRVQGRSASAISA